MVGGGVGSFTLQKQCYNNLVLWLGWAEHTTCYLPTKPTIENRIPAGRAHSHAVGAEEGEEEVGPAGEGELQVLE